MPKWKTEYGEARLEGDSIVIRLPVRLLQSALDGGSDLGTIGGHWTITDPDKFAKDLMEALNEEDEDGTSVIHQLFDQAFNNAIDAGSLWIEEAQEEEE